MMRGLYISRKEALAEGFTHEGSHFGAPIWAQYDEATGEMGDVATKFAPLEAVLDIGAGLTRFCNSFRDPGEEYMFAFKIRPIA